MAAAARKIGLIVNPIAGMGGSTALKGHRRRCHPGPRARAGRRAPGARPRAARSGAPCRRCRAKPRSWRRRASWVRMWRRPPASRSSCSRASPPRETSAEDTRRAAVALRDRGVSLILFAGGDGTARDILDVRGRPSFRSSAFPPGSRCSRRSSPSAPRPRGSSRPCWRPITTDRIAFREAEVMDIDEEGLRAGRVSARLYGYARVPFERRLMQSPKAGGLGGGCDAGRALPRDRRGDGAGC